MTPPDDPIRIGQDELYSADVEDYLAVQHNLRRDVGELNPQPLLLRIIYASWFYLALASGFGAFVAWMILEPLVEDNPLRRDPSILLSLMIFPMVTGFVGLFLGAAEGIMCRNVRRAFVCGLVGLGIGFGAGLLAMIPARIIFTVMVVMAFRMSPDPLTEGGLALLILIMGRGAAWAVASLPAGLGQGIALRERKVILNGIVGGVLGGLVGGLLFDPIYIALSNVEEAAVSRAVGFVCIGLAVGLFVGLVEGWTKTAWLLMQKGPLAGKQFIIFRDETVLGSSPKADIYLFKDDAIEPRHAVIRNRGGRFEIEDCDTPDGTYVNGIPIERQVLQTGDQIVLGKTVLEFSIKDSA
jgi:hypothetical protein